MKELKDTVDGMLSTDYRERFVAEYQQTKIRYEKLKAFCNRVEAAVMQKYMGLYLAQLELRAVIENVELET